MAEFFVCDTLTSVAQNGMQSPSRSIYSINMSDTPSVTPVAFRRLTSDSACNSPKRHGRPIDSRTQQSELPIWRRYARCSLLVGRVAVSMSSAVYTNLMDVNV